MNKNIFINVVSFLFIFVLLSCSADGVNMKDAKDKEITKKEIEEYLEKRNRDFLVQEANLINSYIERNNLDVVNTGTGLRYQIHEQGDGILITEGDVVTLEYEMRLLDGNLICSSENDGKKTFLVGRGGVESGLEEAVLKLCKNSVATLIIPAHLGHGLIGDGNKIPSQATLVYKLKVVDKQ